MKKEDFMRFYDSVIKVLGERFEQDYPKLFKFCSNPDSLYEEYLNQKNMMRNLYRKKTESNDLLDRHKVCACMTAAIVKVRLLITIKSDVGYEIAKASRVNEQLAFMSSWELMKGFVRCSQEGRHKDYKLPETYHNISFLDTVTRSLFLANQLNGISTPLIANIFFLLEKYCETAVNISSVENKKCFRVE